MKYFTKHWVALFAVSCLSFPAMAEDGNIPGEQDILPFNQVIPLAKQIFPTRIFQRGRVLGEAVGGSDNPGHVYTVGVMAKFDDSTECLREASQKTLRSEWRLPEHLEINSLERNCQREEDPSAYDISGPFPVPLAPFLQVKMSENNSGPYPRWLKKSFSVDLKYSKGPSLHTIYLNPMTKCVCVVRSSPLSIDGPPKQCEYICRSK